MQVESTDCVIVQAQFGNYLSGSGLTAEAVEFLESHVESCEECDSALADRREKLKAMLANEKRQVDFDRIAQEAESIQTRSIATALRKQSLQRMLEPAAPIVEEIEPSDFEAEETEEAEVQAMAEPEAVEVEPEPETVNAPTPIRPRRSKNLVYAVGLVAVLAGGIVFAANSDAILGSKPESSSLPETFAVSSNPRTEAMPEIEPEPPKEVWIPLEDFGKPVATDPKTETPSSDVKPVEEPAKPTVNTTVAPKPAVQPAKAPVKKWSRRKPVRRKSTRRVAPRKSSVKVYNP